MKFLTGFRKTVETARDQRMGLQPRSAEVSRHYPGKRYSLAHPNVATHISFVQVFDRFLTNLMAVDHFLYTNAQSTDDNVFCFSRAFYHAIHQTCQKLV